MTKTRIEDNYHKSFGPVTLWWDDVAAIFDLLSRDCKTVELKTNEYVFTTLEEAREHFDGVPQHKVKFSAREPTVVIEPKWMWLESGKESAKLFIELDKIIGRRERRLVWLSTNAMFFPLLATGFAAWLWPYSQGQAWIFALQAVLFIVVMRGVWIDTKRPFVIYPWRQSEKKGFFSRNKDQLLMYIITGVVGALVGFAISQAKDKYLPDWLRLEQKP